MRLLIDVLWIPAQRFVFSLFYRFSFSCFPNTIISFPKQFGNVAKWFGASEQKNNKAGGSRECLPSAGRGQ
jgi:hypothetical protein